jgi:hypothetical protein
VNGSVPVYHNKNNANLSLSLLSHIRMQAGACQTRI